MSKKIIAQPKTDVVSEDHEVVIGVSEDDTRTFYLPEFGKKMSLSFMRGMGAINAPGLSKRERKDASQYAITLFIDYLDEVNPDLLDFAQETFDEPVEVLGQILDGWMEASGFNPKAQSSAGSAKSTQKRSKQTSSNDSDDQ